MRIQSFILLIAAAAIPAYAQAPRTSPTTPTQFDTGFVASAAWLQANELPLDRNAFQSASLDIGFRRDEWAFGAGWLRIARDLSTVQGGTLSVGRLFHVGPVLLIAAVQGLLGEAYRSVDSTGYDFVTPGGLRGHQARFSYSDGFSAGGGVGLTVEYPVYRFVGVRVAAAQWFFSGSPLENDRSRTVLGAGLSVRVR
jgi:hypothetical protein